MRSRTSLTGLLAMAVSLAAVPAAAQSGNATVRELSGRITASSPKDSDSPYQVQLVDLQAGQRYSIAAQSESFDTKLRVSFADDYDETLAEDDDGGEGTNSYLEFTPAKTGKFRVRVTSYNDNKGDYAVTVKRLPALPALLRPTAVKTSTMQLRHYDGSIDDGDAIILGQKVDDYVFRFEAGKTVFVSMTAQGENLDPFLAVFKENEREGKSAIVTDDDSGGGTNALLTFIPEESGNFIVRASGISGSEGKGPYQLRVGQEP